jgi:hypothetical protein
MRVLSLLLTAFALSACSPAQEPSTSNPIRFESDPTVLTGYRTQNWEAGSTVYALGLEGIICLTSTNETRNGLANLEQSSGEAIFHFLEARGRLSERGRYGHMGTCTYTFEVQEVQQDRPITEGEREALFGLARNVFMAPPRETPGAGFDRSFETD